MFTPPFGFRCLKSDLQKLKNEDYKHLLLGRLSPEREVIECVKMNSVYFSFLWLSRRNDIALERDRGA